MLKSWELTLGLPRCPQRMKQLWPNLGSREKRRISHLIFRIYMPGTRNGKARRYHQIQSGHPGLPLHLQRLHQLCPQDQPHLLLQQDHLL